MKKIILSTMLSATLLSTPVAALPQPSLPLQVEAATAIKLNKTKLTLNVGTSYRLKLNTTKKVTWSTSSKTVATVSSTGYVKAKKKGTATIYAKVGTKRYTCKVTVKQPVTKVTLNKTALTLTKKGQIYTLKPTVLPSSANVKTLTWKSSNKKVATVTSKGKVTALKNGTATITATTKDGSKKYATCKVSVKIPVKVKSLSLHTKKKTLTKKNQKYTLKPTITPSNATNQTLTWKSSNKAVATVDKNGIVTALKNGTATITATTTDGSKKSATCKITVKIADVKVTSLKLSETKLVFHEVGKIIDGIQCEIFPANATNKRLYWYSMNENIATVGSKGIVLATGIGETDIVVAAMDGSGVTTSCHIVVDAPYPEITLDKDTINFNKIGATMPLNANISQMEQVQKIIYTSSNEDVASVDENGIITANANGKATITVSLALYTSDKVIKKEIEVTVNEKEENKEILVTSITIEPENVTLTSGNTLTLTAKVYPENATDKELVWRTDHNGVAEVDENGTIKALESGTCNIYASTKDNRVYGVCHVKVPEVPADSLTLKHREKIYTSDNTYYHGLVEVNEFSLLKAGESEVLAAIIYPETTTNKELIWESTDESIATVNETGTVTATCNYGSCEIIATIKGSNISAHCTVNVGIFNTTIYGIDEDGFLLDKDGHCLESTSCTIGSYEELPIDLEKVTFETDGITTGKDRNIEINGNGMWNGHADFSWRPLRKGKFTVNAIYEGNVIRTWNFTVKCDWKEWTDYCEWRKNVESQIWNDSMSVKEKLDAAKEYIKTHFTYGSPTESTWFVYEQTKANCTGASLLMYYFAKDINDVKVAYASATGVISEYIADVSSNMGNHMWVKVDYGEGWVDYDAQPPVWTQNQ